MRRSGRLGAPAGSRAAWLWLAIIFTLSAVSWLNAELSTATAQGLPIDVVDTRPGEAVYVANCAACHQVMGAGIARAVPPLAGSLGDLLAAPGGRSYLVAAVLYGVSGPLTVDGQVYEGVMPAWRHLSDAQLAAVLNYVATSWHNLDSLPVGTEAYTAFEVALGRTDFMTSREVARSRPGVAGDEAQ